MRIPISSILCFSLAFASCDNKAENPKGSTQAEVYVLHEAAGKLQAKNLGAVLDIASKEKPLSGNELMEPVIRLSVSDIVVNEKENEHSGNARVVLLQDMMTAGDHLKLFDAAEAYGRIRTLAIPLPTEIHPGSGNDMLVRSAAFTREAPTEDANTVYFAGYRAMVEEFVSLKYLLLLRTIAVKKSQKVELDLYSPGVYGGQLMVFDLANRKLLGTLPILASNKMGTKAVAVADVHYHLNSEIEKRIKETLAIAQGIPSEAKPLTPSPAAEAAGASQPLADEVAEAKPACAPLRVSIDGTNTPMSQGLAVENKFGIEVLLFNETKLTCKEILGQFWGSPPGQIHVSVREKDGTGNANTDERNTAATVRSMGPIGAVGSTVSLCLEEEITFAASNGKPTIVMSGRFDGTFCGRAR